jgi:hypothetical protein
MTNISEWITFMLKIICLYFLLLHCGVLLRCRNNKLAHPIARSLSRHRTIWFPVNLHRFNNCQFHNPLNLFAHKINNWEELSDQTFLKPKKWDFTCNAKILLYELSRFDGAILPVGDMNSTLGRCSNLNGRLAIFRKALTANWQWV